MRIIAFSGKKQSGKTTAVEGLAEKLCEQDKEYFEVSFADALKELVYRYMILPAKDEVNNWGGMYVDSFSSESIKNSAHPCGKTIRELLQTIGTDWFRNMWPDVWVKNYKETLKQTTRGSILLTADVRFPNEVKCIQDLGGHVIRLLRNPHNDKHESETALDNIGLNEAGYNSGSWIGQKNMTATECRLSGPHAFGFDAILDNRNMDIPEQNEAVWKLVQERKWL